MLEEGKISAEEATTLLRAISGGQRSGPSRPGPGGSEHRFLHIHVTDLDTGVAKVNVTVPMGLVSAGLRMAERFAPDAQEFDMEELETLLASGVTGKLIEVVDDQDQERVEIYVE
jgi:hypothetical protein